MARLASLLYEKESKQDHVEEIKAILWAIARLYSLNQAKFDDIDILSGLHNNMFFDLFQHEDT